MGASNGACWLSGDRPGGFSSRYRLMRVKVLSCETLGYHLADAYRRALVRRLPPSVIGH